MSSIYEQLSEACRGFGKNAGEALKEINYLIATSNKKEREIMADKVPYSEIMQRMHGDINYIAEEAYCDGYDHCEKEMREHAGESYQRGLDDAWEAAKKLFSSMADSEIEKVFPVEWNNGGFKALMDLKPQEAINKIKAYEEQKADEEVKVGDEVDWSGDRFIVTRIYKLFGYKNHCDGIGKNGCVYNDILVESLVKTGRTFPLVASIVEEMTK